MSELLVTLPRYYKDIVVRLQNADWLVHRFIAQDSEDLYSPATYLYNIVLERIQYKAIIDLNVFQYIVNSVKKPKIREPYRNACALLVFCRIADIKVEPNLAVYERINYNAGNLNEAIVRFHPKGATRFRHNGATLKC